MSLIKYEGVFQEPLFMIHRLSYGIKLSYSKYRKKKLDTSHCIYLLTMNNKILTIYYNNLKTES